MEVKKYGVEVEKRGVEVEKRGVEVEEKSGGRGKEWRWRTMKWR